MKYNTATPYLAAYLILRNNNKVATVLRAHTQWMNNYYGLPAGKVEKDESFMAAAVREAKEEIGVTIAPTDLHHALTVYRNGDDETYWIDIYFEVDKWEGEVTNAEPHMHSAVEWFDLDELPDNVIPSVKIALEAIRDGKNFIEHGWEE